MKIEVDKEMYDLAVQGMKMLYSFTMLKEMCLSRDGGCKGCPANQKIGDRYLCDSFSTMSILQKASLVFRDYLIEIGEIEE